jgi:hypothetical protein
MIRGGRVALTRPPFVVRCVTRRFLVTLSDNVSTSAYTV